MPEYPLSEQIPDQLKSPTGIAYSEITLEAVLEGRVTSADLRVTSDALARQAQIAEAAGRRQLAENLLRAGELVGMPDEKILQIYNALRPGRATLEELLGLADEMERNYAAPRCAALIREASAH